MIINNQYQTKTFCFSSDGRYMYATSVYLNELIVYDRHEEKIVKKIKIEGELNLSNLFCGMVYFENRLLLIPQEARAYYLIDLADYSQCRIETVAFGTDYILRKLGVFACAEAETIILVNRVPLRVFVLDINTLEISEISLPENCKNTVGSECSEDETKIYIYCNKEKKIITIDKENKFVNIIYIPEEDSYYGIRYWNNFFYILRNNDTIQKYSSNMDSVELRKLDNQYYFVMVNGQLKLISMDGKKVRNLNDNSIVEIENCRNNCSVFPSIYNLSLNNYILFENNEADRLFRFNIMRLEENEDNKTYLLIDDGAKLSVQDREMYVKQYSSTLTDVNKLITENKLQNIEDFIRAISN